MQDEIPDMDVAVKVHDRALEVWRSLAGMKDYELGGLLIMLAGMYVSCYPAGRREDIYERIGDGIASLTKTIGMEQHMTALHGPRDETGFIVKIGDSASDAMLKDPILKDMVNEALARIKQTLAGIDRTDREAVEAAMQSIGAVQMSEDETEELAAKLAKNKPQRPN